MISKRIESTKYNDFHYIMVQASKSSYCKNRFAIFSAPIVISNPKIVRELIRDIVESIASRSIQRDLFELCRLMSGVFLPRARRSI